MDNREKISLSWNEFLKELEDKNYKEEKQYLQSIKYISEIDVQNIDDSKIRDEINNNLNCIVAFIKNHKDTYYEISLIQGFRSNEPQNGKIIDGRDYYYYIADQKMKATVYYARYLNFIHNCDRYLEERKIANSIEYKIYMMFNNMMREIRFFGAAYQYLWHWSTHEKNLYRGGRLEVEQNDSNPTESNSKENFLKQMFTDCIGHMNSPSQVRHSFSENPLLDIYKYLILPKADIIDTTNENLNANLNENLKITCKAFTNKEKSVQFHIIKNAGINRIFTDQDALSFYEYVIAGDSKVEGYSVEMYPQDLLGERNEKGTVKGMRDTLLPLYFASWGIKAELSKTNVADDKEVITYGKCYAKEVQIEGENPLPDYNMADNGTLFTMELKKNDILELLLKIYKKKKKQTEDGKAVEEIVNKIVDNMKFSEQLKGRFKNYFEGETNQWTQICSFHKFEIVIEANEGYRNAISEGISLQEASEQLKDKIMCITKNYLIDRYISIIKKQNSKAEFVLSTISDNEFNFKLISQYNEYSAYEDSEIAMLKYIIFKEA